MTFAGQQGGMMVPPFNDPKIIRGQATVGKEILEQISGVDARCEAIDMLILPVGGGGLSAGVTRYFEESGIYAGIRLCRAGRGAEPA